MFTKAEKELKERCLARLGAGLNYWQVLATQYPQLEMLFQVKATQIAMRSFVFEFKIVPLHES
ncbi:hypothetical protein [Brevibacillus sp. MER 51]|uniref:hypothetical protein n=1 Tax=Brevibacillus sp. MER 51 TaxID=2939560 RepID=UPI00203DDAE1|nr:hypothetical protein [Brevibacillus sp. MER 51]MCM3146225.1 hypothetical protein [Brevibacillus sp. MER 51]